MQPRGLLPHDRISLKTRLLLIQKGIWLVGMVVAGLLTLDHARAAVRSESASDLISVNTGTQTTIETGGGVYVGGSVHTGGGDFVGRDRSPGCP